MSKTSVVEHYDLIIQAQSSPETQVALNGCGRKDPFLICSYVSRLPRILKVFVFDPYLFRIYLNLPEVFSFYLFSGIIVLWKLYKDAPIIIQSPTRLCEFTQKVQIKQQDLHLKVWRYFSKAFTFFSFYAQRSPITPLTNIFSKLVFWNCSKTILEFRKVRIKTSFNWQWADKQEI